jgi:hypothetical protein
MSSQSSRYCHYYLQGRCTFGDTCNYLHASPPSAKDANTPSSIYRPRIMSAQACKFYRQGRCTSGRSCSFSHSMPLSVSPGESPRTSTEPCIFFKRGACTKGSACSFSHQVEAEAILPLHSPPLQLTSNIHDQRVPKTEVNTIPIISNVIEFPFTIMYDYIANQDFAARTNRWHQRD